MSMSTEKTYLYETPHGDYTVWLEKQKYANGRVALMLMDKEGQVACATCNLPYDALGEGEVFIKTWSENEYMLPFLIKNHLVTDTGCEVPTGMVKARIVKLLV
jgi:hypothetical protein